ncbi:MAG: hypothetical protein CLLPBCKN_007554 [Chroococcidiopsis cubana SAG 39.79]|nr:hypothetical protein [Chroococcidiopsis cubana SAG 39.79]
MFWMFRQVIENGSNYCPQIAWLRLLQLLATRLSGFIERSSQLIRLVPNHVQFGDRVD